MNRRLWFIGGAGAVILIVVIIGIVWLRGRSIGGEVKTGTPSPTPLVDTSTPTVANTSERQQKIEAEVQRIKNYPPESSRTVDPLKPTFVTSTQLRVRPSGKSAPATNTTPPPNTTASEGSSDSDHDGLTDDEEAKLGTDPHNPDTDGDGLSDGDEVLKYGTNPLKADTDGDGYPDGAEVQKGYNPLGSGKCLKLGCSK